MSLIIDVSSNNHSVDYAVAKKAGLNGVFVKATEGTGYINPRFYSEFVNARKAGLYVGAYHFARPDQHTAVPEADFFVSVIQGHYDNKVDTFKPALDYEQHNNLTPREQVAWIKTFNQRVKQKLSLLPIFYSFSSFIEYLDFRPPVGNGLWLANFGENDGTRHPVKTPKPWKKVHLHQYTSVGALPGVVGHVDKSYAPSLTPLLSHPVKARLTRVVR